MTSVSGPPARNTASSARHEGQAAFPQRQKPSPHRVGILPTKAPAALRGRKTPKHPLTQRRASNQGAFGLAMFPTICGHLDTTATAEPSSSLRQVKTAVRATA